MNDSDWKSRPVAYDCRYFRGDRPCVWHKRERALCYCEHYEAIAMRILIVKLDAMGDVLRTTCILDPLRRQYPDAAITWLTRADSLPLLENNPYLSDVLALGPDAIAQISAQRFDQVINLDAGRTSASLAKLADAKERIGFVLDDLGYVTATNSAAEMWLKMGLFDDLKRSNTRSYPDIMCQIVGLSNASSKYVLHLGDAEIDAARRHLVGLGISFDRPLVGLSAGAGGRWAFKRWREEGFAELIDSLHAEGPPAPQIVLLGGRDDTERNQRIKRQADGLASIAESPENVRHFAALISHCDVIVCGDTLAMHIAIALRRRVVVLFGPTSVAEIDLFGTGSKIVPDLDCLGCYKTECDFKPNCMETITCATVKSTVLSELAVARRPQSRSK